MPDVANIVKKIDQAGAIFLGQAKTPLLPESDAKGRARELEVRKKYLDIIEATFAEIKDNQASFSEEDKKAILAAKVIYDKRIKEAETKYPEKMKFLKSGDAAAGFNPDLEGSKAQGDQDGKELEKNATDWGKTVNGWFNSAKKTATEAVDDAKELLNADGTPKTEEQKRKDKEAAAAKDGKDKGFLDSITDWFSNVNAKEIVGGLAGGGIGYMLGKIFGEGTLGTIAGILMSLGGAVMGRKFAHDHFNGDDKESAAKGGNAGKTGKAGVGATSQQAGADGGVNAEQANAGPGMTDEELRAALEKYNKEIGNTLNMAKPAELTKDELLEYKLAHPLVPNITKSSKPEVQDDLYGR